MSDAIKHAWRAGRLAARVSIEAKKMTDALREIEAQDRSWVADYIPQVLPYPWEVIERGEGKERGAIMARSLGGLQVIASGRTERDGLRWLHVSFSRRDRLPTYKDQAEVKELFIGPERYAYTVLPPSALHVNVHQYCLHLWSCIDRLEYLPDFTWGCNAI